MNEGAKKAARSHVRKLAAKTKKTPTLAALRAAGFGPPIQEVRRVKAAEALRKAEQEFLKAGYAFAKGVGDTLRMQIAALAMGEAWNTYEKRRVAR